MYVREMTDVCQLKVGASLPVCHILALLSPPHFFAFTVIGHLASLQTIVSCS